MDEIDPNEEEVEIKSVEGEVFSSNLETTKRMPDPRKREFVNWSPFYRKYAEFRSRGMTMDKSAELAGSKAKDNNSRTRVGYNIEKKPQMKQYIAWLQIQRAKSIIVDEAEVINKIRAIYNASMLKEDYKAANKAAEMLANVIGMFDKQTQSLKKELSNKDNNGNNNEQELGIKNNVNAFKPDDEDERLDLAVTNNRLKKYETLIKNLSKDKQGIKKDNNNN
jgi:hypothetical protein